MEDTNLPAQVLNLGNQPLAIFKALVTHEYMSVPTIIEKTGIHEKSISPCMTQLRRSGWVEYKGSRGHRLWIRREAWAEPQGDLAKRGHKKKKSKRGDVHFHLVQSAFHLNEALRQIGYVDDIQKAVAQLGARMEEHSDNGTDNGGNADDR